MADSANILSILAALGGGPQAPDPGITPTTFTPPPAPDAGAMPANVLQALAPPQGQAAPPQPAAPSSTEDIYHAATADAPPTPPARVRSSLLDKIGRVADVLATVGGASPLYQPTLDARQDRVLALGDHDRKTAADEIALATSKFDLGDKQNTRVGQAARGLKAILTANPNIDVATAWPALAERMNLDPATTASFGKVFAEHPEEIDGVIAAMTDPKFDQEKYGGSVVYGTDANGKLVAYQPGLGNNGGRNVLPEGITPIDPLKFIDTGNAQVGVGTRSGRPTRILPKGVSPDQANRSSTAITIAGMPARASQAPGKGTNGTADMGTANMLLDNIERGFNDLHRLQALPGEGGSAIGQITGALGRTGIGQAIGEQAGNASAQKRVEIEKDINSLQSEMVKSLPASATRTKFEQEIQRRRMPDPARMSYQTAQNVIADLRRMFAQAQKDAAAELAKKSPPAARPAARPKPQSGWTIVKVQ